MLAPATSGSRRRADIQGLRALAVLIVVLFHADLPVPGGFVGVDVFFVISGFVIAGVLVADLGTTTFRFRSFYARRARRLLPALAVLLVAVAVGSTLLLSPLGPQQSTAATGRAAAFFGANVHLMRGRDAGYFDLPAETNALLHTWSLSVEEQFYLVFPALVAAGFWLSRRRDRGTSRRSLFGVVLVGVVASLALSWYLTEGRGSSSLVKAAFYSPATRAWEFGVGVLVAVAAPRLARLSRELALALGAVGVVLIGFSAALIDGTTPFPGTAALLPVAGAALLIVAGTASQGGVSAALSIRPAVWIGDLSYGWYLWHWPAVVFVRSIWPDAGWLPVLAAAWSLVPAWASRRFVEDPLRSATGMTGRRIVGVAALCVVVPALAFTGATAVNELERRSDQVAEYADAAALHGDDAPECPASSPYPSGPDVNCFTYRTDDPRGSLLLVGDSNAIQFLEPLSSAARDLGYELTAATMVGCPFADLIREVAKLDGVACHRFVQTTLAAVRAAPPDLVLIATSAAQVVNDPSSLVDPRTGARATTSTAKAALWQQGVTSVLADLRQAGAPTILIHTIPQLGGFGEDWRAGECPAIRIYLGSCGITVERAAVEHRQAPARAAEERALAAVPGAAQAVDFTGDLCSPDVCAAQRDGLWLYTDATHLSVDGSRTLTGRFRQLIAAHAGPTPPAP